MSYLHCPYCEIKEHARLKEIYSALQPIDGQCPDCGAYLDIGQRQVKINGMFDIYKGAVSLIREVVDELNEILEFCDIDLTDYMDELPTISIEPTQIIERLFVPYVGGTTKANLTRAVGVEDMGVKLEIGKREVEE